MPGEHDPAKPKAACVYLWTRNPKLFNGPAAAGKGFNRSRTEGQLILASGLRCLIGNAAVRWSSINPILRLTGDAEDCAFSNAFARAVEQHTAPVGSADILAAEHSIVAGRFGGSNAAYKAAIAQAHTSVSVARNIIGDELRRARIEARFQVGGPQPAAEISTTVRTSATCRRGWSRRSRPCRGSAAAVPATRSRRLRRRS